MNLIKKFHLPTKTKKNYFSKCISVLILTAIFLFTTGYAYAGTTRYVDPGSPDPGNGYTSWNRAAHDIASAMSAMNGGDELIIRDGTYTGANNMLYHNIPSGPDENNYTVIRAEHDFGVIIDAEIVDMRMPFRIQYGKYIEVHGIEFRRPGDMHSNQASSPVYIIKSDHIKLFRVGGVEVALQARDISTYLDMSNIFTISQSSYILLEECYAWGQGKYIFLTYSSDHIVLRRCISRQDGWVGGVGDNFSSYLSSYVEYQNNIAIDMDGPRHWHPDGSDALWGGFNMNGSADNLEYNAFRGNIVMNITGLNGVTMYDGNRQRRSATYNPAFRLSASNGTCLMENNAVINSVEGLMTYDNVDVKGFTAVNIYIDPDMMWSGTGVSHVTGNRPTIKNSVFANIAREAVAGIATNSDYNAFYGNATNYSYTTPGSHDYSSQNGNHLNMIWSETNTSGGLKYPIRIESDSNLSGKGEGSADIGANITKRYGVNGTLYGESGYNTLTDVDLWPFPNEEIIRSRMKSYRYWDKNDNIDYNNPDNPSTWISGDRGFCADGQTLTKYIWESLGNSIPDDLYEKKPKITEIIID